MIAFTTETPPQLSPEEAALVAELVADGLSIQDKFRAEPVYKEGGRGHYGRGTVPDTQRISDSTRREIGT